MKFLFFFFSFFYSIYLYSIEWLWLMEWIKIGWGGFCTVRHHHIFATYKKRIWEKIASIFLSTESIQNFANKKDVGYMPNVNGKTKRKLFIIYCYCIVCMPEHFALVKIAGNHVSTTWFGVAQQSACCATHPTKLFFFFIFRLNSLQLINRTFLIYSCISISIGCRDRQRDHDLKRSKLKGKVIFIYSQWLIDFK